MTLLLAEPNVSPLGNQLVGDQSPRIYSVPQYVSSSGAEAVELCEMAGLFLDPWQQLSLTDMLGEAATWRCPRCPFLAAPGPRPQCPAHPRAQLFHPWACFEFAEVVNRQNGKGAILLGRELTGLFLFEERLIIHSAHRYDTSMEAFGILLERIEDTPDFDARVQRVNRSHGEEGIELVKPRRRIRFRTRAKGGGKGFTADCVILDEAQFLSEGLVGALMPTLTTRPNPQIIYTANAVDKEDNPNGVALARVRERGIAGGDPALGYLEWSTAVPLTKLLKGTPAERALRADPREWAKANPATGFRIGFDYLAKEYRGMPPRQFCIERLGAGDWPATDEDAAKAIPPALWAEARRPGAPEATGAVCLAFDVTPDQSMASIGAATETPAGPLVEVTGDGDLEDHRAGTAWLPPRLVQLRDRVRPCAIVCDPASQAFALLPELAKLGVHLRNDEHPNGDIVLVTARQHAQGAGMFLDDVTERRLLHLGQVDLDAAVDAAVKRELGDAFLWNRKGGADISPLVACTLARWGLAALRTTGTPEVWDLNEIVARMRAEQEAAEESERPPVSGARFIPL